jgi:hypothetical protein
MHLCLYCKINRQGALESQRISVAGQIFNGEVPDAEMEISDEEIVAEIE